MSKKLMKQFRVCRPSVIQEYGASRPDELIKVSLHYGWRRSRVVMFTAIDCKVRGSNPGQGRNLKTKISASGAPHAAVVKAYNPCRERPIKAPLNKT